MGSINGGQASNLCTFIAKGDVALSVLMTTVTVCGLIIIIIFISHSLNGQTIAGIFMTPLLCKMILGAVVPVDAVGIAVSCLQVVLAPIAVGMVANKYGPSYFSFVRRSNRFSYCDQVHSKARGGFSTDNSRDWNILHMHTSCVCRCTVRTSDPGGWHEPSDPDHLAAPGTV